MQEQQQLIPWTRPGWLGDVEDWIRAALTARDITITGAIEQAHAYPWSTVLRVPTDVGTIFCKAVSPLGPHEAAVLDVLRQTRPDCAPRVVTSDIGRGLILMRDAGHMLRNDIRPNRDIRPWLMVLPAYAQLQIDMVEQVPQLLAAGVPDRRLAVLPDLYASLLADTEVLRIGEADGITREQHERLRALPPRVRELCDQLVTFQIPETINHGDLTDGNILIEDGRPIFIDWGDCCVSHPFYSLRTAIVSAEISLELDEYAPETQPLRDAYLAGWSRFGSQEDLAAALRVSAPLASINGAATWYRLVSKLQGALREKYAHIVPAYLQELLYLVEQPPGPS